VRVPGIPSQVVPTQPLHRGKSDVLPAGLSAAANLP
jgi:hypothetical protein